VGCGWQVGQKVHGGEIRTYAQGEVELGM